jgi:hypothetical protein
MEGENSPRVPSLCLARASPASGSPSILSLYGDFSAAEARLVVTIFHHLFTIQLVCLRFAGGKQPLHLAALTDCWRFDCAVAGEAKFIQHTTDLSARICLQFAEGMLYSVISREPPLLLYTRIAITESLLYCLLFEL